MSELFVHYDETMLAHEAPSGEFDMPWSGRLGVREPHPDRPERIENIVAIVESELEERTTWVPVEPATRDDIERAHAPAYVDDIREWSADGGGRRTYGTGGNVETYRAARFAAGAAIDAADRAVSAGLPDVQYALVRPSGHHAQPAQSDGYCFFNNVAIAAEAALERETVDRVAILDWDVHHANGTQEVFYDRDDVLLVSLHNDHPPWDATAHPQSCDLSERGTGDGRGYTVNVPLPPGTGNEGYRYAMETLVEPVIDAFSPDLLLASAGGDPGIMDPLGANLVTKTGFEALGASARRFADTHADGALAIVQEGGYHLSHLPYATLGVLEGALAIETGVEDPFAWMSAKKSAGYDAIDRARDVHAEHWPTG